MDNIDDNVVYEFFNDDIVNNENVVNNMAIEIGNVVNNIAVEIGNAGAFNIGNRIYPANFSIGANGRSSDVYEPGNCHITASNTVSVGTYANANHKGSIVIGSHATSHDEDCVTLNDNIFANHSLFIADKSCLIGNNITDSEICSSCNDDIMSGIKWYRETESKSTTTLCFNCIFDTVMQYKAKEQWINHLGYDPITKLTNDVSKLQTEIQTLKDQLKL